MGMGDNKAYGHDIRVLVRFFNGLRRQAGIDGFSVLSVAGSRFHSLVLYSGDDHPGSDAGWCMCSSMLGAISKDFVNLIRAFTTALFWLSGIMFDITSIDNRWVQLIFKVNPDNIYC